MAHLLPVSSSRCVLAKSYSVQFQVHEQFTAKFHEMDVVIFQMNVIQSPTWCFLLMVLIASRMRNF